MERNKMKRNEMERNEMKICSLQNENLSFAKWESVVCEMKICSLRNENPLENADFKFSVNNEGEDRRNIA